MHELADPGSIERDPKSKSTMVVSMKTQVKIWGTSHVIVLSPEFIKFNNLKVGDWIDLDGAAIISDSLKKIKDEGK